MYWLPISERIKYEVACVFFGAIIGSGPAYLCYISTHRLVHFICSSSDVLILKVQQAFALSLASDPTFGIHSHKTLDIAQPCNLLKPN